MDHAVLDIPTSVESVCTWFAVFPAQWTASDDLSPSGRSNYVHAFRPIQGEQVKTERSSSFVEIESLFHFLILF